MHFTNAAAAVSLLAISAHAWKPSSTNGTDRLAAIGKAKLEKHHAALGYNSSCSSDNTAVRKEWLSLSDEEKIAYTDAVKCLMELPSISGDAIPGAKSRFDDFVGVHINQTPFIHVTVSIPFVSKHCRNLPKTGQLPLMAPLLHLDV
jgi:tyrosinase